MKKLPNNLLEKRKDQTKNQLSQKEKIAKKRDLINSYKIKQSTNNLSKTSKVELENVNPIGEIAGENSQDEIKRYLTQIRQLKIKNQNQEFLLKKKNIELKRLKKLTLQDPDLAERVKNERKELKKRANEAKIQLEIINGENKRLVRTIINYNADAEKARNEVVSAQRQVEIIRRQLNEANNQYFAQRAEIQKLQWSLKNESNRQAEKNKITRLQNENKRLNESLEKQTTINLEQRNKIQDLTENKFRPFGSIYTEIDQLARNLSLENIDNYANISFLIARYNYFSGKRWYDNWQDALGVIRKIDDNWVFESALGDTDQIDKQAFLLRDGDVFEASVRQKPLRAVLLKRKPTEFRSKVSVERKKLAYRKSILAKYPAKMLTEDQKTIEKVLKHKRILLISATFGASTKRNLAKYHLNITTMDENGKSIDQIVNAVHSKKYDFKYVFLSGISHSLYYTLIKNNANEECVFLYDSNAQGIVDDAFIQTINQPHFGKSQITGFFKRVLKNDK